MIESMSLDIIYYCPLNPANEPNPFMAAIWLTSRGHPLTYVGEGAKETKTCPTPLQPLPVHLIPRGRSRFGRMLWHVKAALALLKMRWRHKGRVIFYLQRHESTVAAFFGLMFFPGRQIVFHTQDYLEPGRHPFWAFFEKRIARKAAFVISNEPNRARFMASHYRLKNFPVVVRTALPQEWPVPERDLQLRQQLLGKIGLQDAGAIRLIMAAGAYSKVRCTRELIQAVGKLDPRYVLVFTGMKPGTATYETTLNECRQAGIADRVVILPFLDYEDLLRHMAACDVGILLYPNDGVGNFYQAPGRLTEYMSAGLPSVASNFPGLELLVRKYQLGQVCDPESPSDIAEAIDRIGSLSQEDLERERLRLRKLAKTEFAYETQAWLIEEVLEALSNTGE
jgi:glycosyltransferase involved in cell wall biosynthesis